MKTKITVVLCAFLAMMACHDAPTPPQPVVPITISSPSNGATLSDRVTVSAVPGEGYIFTRVEFYIDSALVASDSLRPFQYDWNIFAYQSGTNHSLYAIGITADTSYISALINVRIEFTQGFSLVSTYSPGSQNAIGITNFYNVLFVSTGDAGLEVLDITTKASPRFRSRLVVNGQALHSAVLFPYVYVAELNQVEMANFENVDSMIPVHVYQAQSLVRDVAVSTHFVFSIENDGLSILSPSTLQPYPRHVFDQDQLTYAVARHDTAFIVGNNSFYIVDCTNPNSSLIVGSYNALSLGNSVAVSDTFAFISNGSADPQSGGIIALSISHPGSPRFLARFNPGQIMTSVFAGDGVLFAGSNSNTVYALSYSTPGSLITLDQYNVGNIVKEIKYASNYLYVAASTDVTILRFVR